MGAQQEVKGATYDRTPLVLCGNKSDVEVSLVNAFNYGSTQLSDGVVCLQHLRKIPTQEGEAYLSKLHEHATFFETSALNGSNVNEAFHSIIEQFRIWNPPKSKKGKCSIL